jgi:galactokinase/mevalonate kinase-like predicted kinase
MGMEPFVAADDNAFGHLIGSIPDPVRNLREALAFKVGLDSRRAQAAQDEAQAAEIGQKLTREQMFQQDAAAVGSNPDARAISSLMTKYPEFADKLKQGWDVKDKAAQQSDLTQLGEIYSAAASGKLGPGEEAGASAARCRQGRRAG